MALPRIDRVPLSRTVYETLLRAIVAGELAPGVKLRDKDLAVELGVSRTPVREALQRLEDEGLVETAPNVATRVAPIDAARLAEAFPVVAVLHGLGARLGVPALTRAHDRRMAAADRRRTQALERGDVVAAIEADDDLHDVLLEAARNAELRRTLARLMPLIRRLDVLHFTALAEGEAARDDHAAILDACARRDAHEAAALVEQSFLVLGEHLARALDQR
jgi:DNA-binding GntR family transcriptional regulator